jgi:hypothetical protein
MNRTANSATALSAMRIVNAEKRLLTHIQLGGRVTDPVGKELVQGFIATALKDSEIARISETYNLSAENLGTLYANSIQKLLPQPCICDGGPIQIPNRVGFLFAATLFFMEPRRLEGMAREIEQKVRTSGPATLEFTNEEGIEVKQEVDGSDLAWIIAIGEVSERDARLVREVHEQNFGPAKFSIEERGGLKSAKGCLILIGALITTCSTAGYFLFA